MDIPAFRRLLLAGLLLSSSFAGAQQLSTGRTAVPDNVVPLSSNLQYFSVFTHYQYFSDPTLLSWQEANDNVGKIGGWRFYARDSQQPEKGASTAEAKSDSEETQPSGSSERSEQHSEHGRKP